MRITRFFIALLLALPLALHAGVTAGDLPGNTVWYMHADLEQLRTTDSGAAIAEWFDAEVGSEIRDEVGIDLAAEVNSVTAYSDGDNGTVILVEGPLSDQARNKLVALATLEGNIEERSHDGNTYYLAGDEEEMEPSDEPFDDLDDAAFFTFAVDGKAIITSDEAQLKAMIDNGGRIVGGDSHEGALFVLTADVSFVQAGLRTEGLVDDDDDDGDGDWESNIIRNTEQAALLIADSSGQIAVEAQLRSKDPKMAESIGGIVNGLISLQAFNSELPPEIQTLVANTKVEVDGAILTINTVIDPELIVSVLND